jgi:STE24 endopeptidase
MQTMTITLILFILYLFVIASGYWLRSINLRYLKLHGAEVPSGFEGAIDTGILARTTAYTVEQSRLGLIESVVDNILLLVFLFGGLLGLYDRWISSLSSSFVV